MKAGLLCLSLTGCYKAPINDFLPQESTYCTLNFSDGYDINMPCESKVTPFRPAEDPGAGVLSIDQFQIYFKCSYTLFDNFKTVLEGTDSEGKVYYIPWSCGYMMLVKTHENGRDIINYYLKDDDSEMRLNFWMIDKGQEEQITAILTSLHRP